MIGAIVGDIIGSRFEFNNTAPIGEHLIGGDATFTDETVCIVGLADALMKCTSLDQTLRSWCREYMWASYGKMFSNWVRDIGAGPYGSLGNGCVARVSVANHFEKTKDSAANLAKKLSALTHDHHESLRVVDLLSRALFDGNPECGCFITYDPKNKTMKSTKEVKTYHLYRCSNGKKVHQDFRGAYVHEEKIWEQLSVAIESISIDEDFAKEIASALNETQKQVQEAAKREMQSYREALIKLDDRESELYEDFKSGVLDEAGYRRQVTPLKQQRLHFTDLLEKANLSISDAGFETVRSTIELARDAKSLWLSRSPDERRQFLDELLSNRILDGTNVRYDLKKPFATLVEMKQNENWRTKATEYRTWFIQNPQINVNAFAALFAA